MRVKGGSVEGTIVSLDEIVGLLDGSAVAGSFVGVVGDIDGRDVGINASPHTTTPASCIYVHARFATINSSATLLLRNQTQTLSCSLHLRCSHVPGAYHHQRDKPPYSIICLYMLHRMYTLSLNYTLEPSSQGYRMATLPSTMVYLFYL